MGLLTKLTRLELYDNYELDGSIPTELGLLTKLTILWLNNNSLEGELPVALSDLVDLNVLYLQNNIGLSGTVPVEFKRLTNLNAVYLQNTNISGGFDEAFCSSYTETFTLKTDVECSCCSITD